MKSIGTYIFLGIVLVLSSLFVYIKAVIDSIDFNINLGGINFKNLSTEAVSNGKGYVTLRLGFVIKFIGLFNISFSDLKISAYFRKLLLARSTDNIDNKKKIILVSGINNSIYHDFDIQVNANTIDLSYLISAGKEYAIDYALSFKILGLTVNYTGTYINK